MSRANSKSKCIVCTLNFTVKEIQRKATIALYTEKNNWGLRVMRIGTLHSGEENWVGQKVYMFFSINKRHLFKKFSAVTLLIWIFWVFGYLPHGRILLVLNVSIWLLSFNWSTWPWSVTQWEISSTKLCNCIWHVCSVTAPSPYTAQIFFHIFTFFVIIKYNRPKMSLIFFHLQNQNGYTKIHQFW